MKTIFIVQHFSTEVIKKVLCPDDTSCVIMDYDTGEDFPCKILKSNRNNVEMYLGKGWYAFAKSKKFKIGDKLHCTYRSEEKCCM